MSVLAPLLRPASWRLSPGAADVPWLRHLGLALLLGSTLALLAWCLAIWFDAWRLRRLDWASALAVPLCALGLSHAWRLGLAWLKPGAQVTLRWTGPVVAPRPGEPSGGWRVDEWGAQPVEVSLIWDWQRVMLLRVKPWTSASHQVWVWLQDRPSQPEREVHRLRTLLCLPPAMTCPPEMLPKAMPVGRAGMVASSRHDSPAVSARMTRGRTPSRTVSRSPNAAMSTPLRVEDDFPATQVLDRWSDEVAEVAAADGGRP